MLAKWTTHPIIGIYVLRLKNFRFFYTSRMSNTNIILLFVRTKVVCFDMDDETIPRKIHLVLFIKTSTTTTSYAALSYTVLNQMIKH